MCTQRLHISNPSYKFPNCVDSAGRKFVGVTHAVNDVPCGHCEACLQAKRDAYVLRSQVEFERCNHKAVFVTLTYDKRNLPIYRWETEPVFDLPKYTDTCDYLREFPAHIVHLIDDDKGNTVHRSYTDYTKYFLGDVRLDDGEVLCPPRPRFLSVWDKSHIQDFFKRLNEQLIYYIGTEIYHLKRLVTIDGHRRISDEWKKYLANSPRPIKYLVTCERGSDKMYLTPKGKKRKGTARPHYHAIIFLENKYLQVGKVLRMVRELWTYGYSYNIQITSSRTSDKNLGRSFSQSIEYVCKYVTKDLADKSFTIPFRNRPDDVRHKPFLLLSHGLGDNLFDGLTDNEIVNLIVNGQSVKSCSSNLDRTIQIPTYNLRNHLYVREKEIASKMYDVSTITTDSGEVILCPTDLQEDAKFIRTRSYLTPLGQRVKKELLEAKAQHYKEMVETIQSVSISVSQELVEDCLLISPDEMYDYIINDLYQHGDDMVYHPLNYERYALLYNVYLRIREYDNKLAEDKRKLHAYMYEQRIYEAMKKKPHLFNLTPISL